MSSSRNIVMTGLPGSGKTTFLAALWHQLESSEVPTIFTTSRLQPDREYLNRIRDNWLAFEEVSRAGEGMERSALLHLRHRETGQDLDLSIPDVRGETFANLWLTRRVLATYVDQLQQMFGLVLFVHSEQVVRREMLPVAPSTTGGNTPSEWMPEHAPTQVQLVDLLQSSVSLAALSHLRVAIVVSAWDLVADGVSPERWLEINLPLLDQFRNANSALLESKVFGVSALGGSLSDSERLSLVDSPSSRVRIQIGIQPSRDLTAVIEFLTQGPCQ